jgi:hypothetical protein
MPKARRVEVILKLPCGHELSIDQPLGKWNYMDRYIVALQKCEEMHRCELVTDENPAGLTREH